MPLTIDIKPSLFDQDMHVMNCYFDNVFFCRQLLSTDEIEDLELNLTNILRKLYKYRGNYKEQSQ